MRWIDLDQYKEEWKVLMNVGFIKCGEILEYLDNWFLKKGSAPLWN
jgi:hypothetical protein